MPIVVTLGSARTLGDLKARIADEVARSDIGPQIALAIEDAISEAAQHRFWFNEVDGVEIVLSEGISTYATEETAALIEIDAAWLDVDGQRRGLVQVPSDRMDALLEGTEARGEPYLYSFYGDRIALHTVPDRSLSLFLKGQSRLFPLVEDTQSNAWTDQGKGERYVRALAKRNLFAEVIYDMERADVQARLADKYRDDLLAQTHSRIATGTMAAHG